MAAIRRRAVRMLVPEGLLATRQWLMKQGLSRHALDNLVKSHEFASLAYGVYARPETKLTWQGIVCSLQHIMKMDLTVGGLTALELQGLQHYLTLSSRKTIHLYGKDSLPTWLNGLLLDVIFIRRGDKELRGRLSVNRKNRAKKKALSNQESLREFTVTHTWREGVWPLTISSPERAYLEVLKDVPEAVSFEHADQLMQGLTNLSPKRLERLLGQCRSIKVRRLFFWFAERHRHAWLKKLNPDHFDMGSGKRMLAKGGKFDTKYQITVPEELWTQTTHTTGKSNS